MSDTLIEQLKARLLSRPDADSFLAALILDEYQSLRRILVELVERLEAEK